MVLKFPGDSLQKVESEFTKIIDSNVGRDEKFRKLFSLMAEGHAETQLMMKEGFVGLAIQNAELNAELKEQNKGLEDQLKQMQGQLRIVREELQERKERERLIEEKKEKRKNQKRLPKREPITIEIYDSLIQSSQKFKYGNLYQSARLRLALALLFVTGIRISELLPLKVNKLESLFAKGSIAIDRMKHGPSNHKAFLTKQGKNIIKKRAKDFEIVLYSKHSDSYIFTPQYSEDPLNRVSFSRIINGFLLEASKELPDKPNIKSHSFRSGFITELWRDSGDIEFVRQTMGHAKIDTTSIYVQNLSDDERREKISSLKKKIKKICFLNN